VEALSKERLKIFASFAFFAAILLFFGCGFAALRQCAIARPGRIVDCAIEKAHR